MEVGFFYGNDRLSKDLQYKITIYKICVSPIYSPPNNLTKARGYHH